MFRTLLISLLSLTTVAVIPTNAVPVSGSPSFPPAFTQEEEPFEEARQLLSQGKNADAKRLAMDVLGSHAYEVDGYDLMREIANAQGE